MRLFMINVLATAMLLTVASQANAISVTQTGTGAGSSYAISDTITLKYYINTIGDPGLSVFAFSVIWDNTAAITPNVTASIIKNKILKGSQDEGGNVNGNFAGLPRIGKNPTIHMDRALSHVAVDAYDEALVDLDRVVELGPDRLGTVIEFIEADPSLSSHLDANRNRFPRLVSGL